MQEPASLVRSMRLANPSLTGWSVLLGTLSGALLPIFILVSGLLIGALSTHHSPFPAAAALIVVFLVERMLDPILEEVGQALWRQIDESFAQRLMTALAGPPGLSQVEDPGVQDLLTQAQGTLTDTTPGQGGYFLGRNIANVVQGVGSLLIVVVYRWWLAGLLLVAYRVAYRFYRAHWFEVTTVLYGRTDRLRHAYYLRRVATEPAAAKETRVFGLSNWLVAAYRQRWLTEMAAVWRARKEGWGVSFGVVGGLGAIEILALGMIATDAAHGHIGVGYAVVLVQAVLGSSMLGQYRDGQWYLSQCAYANDQVEAVESAAAAAVTVARSSAKREQIPTGAIRFEGVTFSYPGNDRAVFEELDLEINPGRSLAIVGDNGAGKTTLVKLLCRLYEPSAGRISIGGIDLRDIDPHSWHRQVAAIFQDYVQFELSVYDNVAYGALHNRDDEHGVEDAVALAGADNIVRRLDRGLRTPLSRELSGGTQLSGGEWQRLALARALFAVRSGARILVLDEPTAALDVRGEAEIYDRFLELTGGITSLVISHRFSTVRRADHIVVIEAGRVTEHGSHDELLEHGGRYATMFRLQASRFAAGEADNA
jgi:ATP-binding cassette, subfamily B, bacterial